MAAVALHARIDRSVVDEATDAIFDAILDGRFGSGARLPAERDLAAALGASRVSVREAIKRLVEWRVVVTRHGSGATVLARRSWTAHALAGVLRHAIARQTWRELLPFLHDAFELRRSVVLDLIERAAGRLAPGMLDGVRRQLERAWSERHDARAFAMLDREVLPAVLEAAGMFPSVWLVNSLAEPYLAVMDAVMTGAALTESYLARNRAVFDALEAGDGARARREQQAYLDELDRTIVAALPDEIQGLMGHR